jgi:hypothetical protein
VIVIAQGEAEIAMVNLFQGGRDALAGFSQQIIELGM